MNEAQLDHPDGPRTFATPVKLVAGLFFTVIGIVMTLDNLDLVNGYRLLRFWPVVLIIIGIIEIARSGNRAVGTLLIALGAVLTATVNRWFRVSIFDLWPLLVIGAGVMIVAQALGFRSGQNATSASGAGGGWSVLSNRKTIDDSPDYAGGRVAALVGTCDLDLTRADIANGTAVVEVLAILGHVTIRVPEGWEVVGDVVPVMGGIEIKTKGATGGRRLVVRGLAFMGGVEIKTFAGRTE